MTFENWTVAVDKAFIEIVGMDRDSWPDQDYWTMWDDGFSPMEAVAAAVENEYGPSGLETFNLTSPY